jgi:dipeptidyl aminopeptidase/acylaminoacyl peptidase
MPWIHPEEMAAMKPIEYRARDGLRIHGYLTLPPNAGSSPRAMVVYVHGGPWARDAWGFEPMVQFLASRGYAVLQVNYRGSSGFGFDAQKRSNRQMGGAIQDDITDGLKWALSSGIADPSRVAIMGASYGGYSALWGATRTPELYRCAIDISGPSDWITLMEASKDREVKYAYDVWSERLGSLKNDSKLLREISPVAYAAQVRAPILIIQGAIDRQVPMLQAQEMVDALKSNGKTCETLYFSDEDHGFRHEKNRVKEFRAIEAFLKKYLPAG